MNALWVIFLSFWLTLLIPAIIIGSIGTSRYDIAQSYTESLCSFSGGSVVNTTCESYSCDSDGNACSTDTYVCYEVVFNVTFTDKYGQERVIESVEDYSFFQDASEFAAEKSSGSSVCYYTIDEEREPLLYEIPDSQANFAMMIAGWVILGVVSFSVLGCWLVQITRKQSNNCFKWFEPRIDTPNTVKEVD